MSVGCRCVCQCHHCVSVCYFLSVKRRCEEPHGTNLSFSHKKNLTFLFHSKTDKSPITANKNRIITIMDLITFFLFGVKMSDGLKEKLLFFVFLNILFTSVHVLWCLCCSSLETCSDARHGVC